MSSGNDMTVFLIDDDDVACEAMERGLNKYDIHFDLITAQDGIEALQVLRHQHPEKKLEQPFVILLDLNMPRMNGFEFLEALRTDPKLSANVVFILTTSNDDKDRMRAYSKQIAGYIVKSRTGPQFRKLTNLLTDYRDAVTLPKVL